MFQIMTKRAESAYGSGVRTTVLTKLKIAVFAPMPKASVNDAAIVNPGALMSSREACRRFRRRVSMARLRA
jgi:hypothetical protein